MNENKTIGQSTSESDSAQNVNINLNEVGPVETKGEDVDLFQYDKQKVKIEDAQATQVKSGYSDTGKQWVLKIISEVVHTLERDGEDNIEFRASELFNLKQDEKGNLVGFPVSDQANLQLFCKDIGINDYEKTESLAKLIEKIKGKETLIKAYEKEKDGNKKTYLKFRY